MENPVAAPQGTEAMPTPSAAGTPEQAPLKTPAPAPAPAPAQPAGPVANIPADKIEEFNRFVAGNGGFEKAFSKLKSDVSAPQQSALQNAQNAQRQYQQAPQSFQGPMPQQMQQQMPQQMPHQVYRRPGDGYLTQEEMNINRYYDDLARDPAFSPIANDIRSGKVIDEMEKFGIKPSDQYGNINDRQVREFLSLLAKAQPAPQHTAPVSNTPTVDYVNVGEQITSRDAALAVLRQNMSLNGAAPHPQTEAAKAFLKQYFSK